MNGRARSRTSSLILLLTVALSMAAPGPGLALPKLKLLSGYEMPALGLGVYTVPPGPDTVSAVASALRVGYRMIDTAMIYRNEESVGQAIQESGIPRSELFVATKLWDSDHGYEQAWRAARESLRKLRLDYVDLYLIHSPNTGKLIETWDALVEIQKAGLARSIGVSNFGPKHLEALVEHKRPLPSVNQFELHPLNYQERKPLVEWCQSRNIVVQAYGSLFFGRSERLAEEVVTKIATSKGKTPAQVLLRWGHQKGFQLIPKSVKQARQEENSAIFDFELSAEEMEQLSSMKGELGAYWQPLNAELDLGDTTRARSDL